MLMFILNYIQLYYTRGDWKDHIKYEIQECPEESDKPEFKKNSPPVDLPTDFKSKLFNLSGLVS